MFCRWRFGFKTEERSTSEWKKTLVKSQNRCISLPLLHPPPTTSTSGDRILTKLQIQTETMRKRTAAMLVCSQIGCEVNGRLWRERQVVTWTPCCDVNSRLWRARQVVTWTPCCEVSSNLSREFKNVKWKPSCDVVAKLCGCYQVVTKLWRGG